MADFYGYDPMQGLQRDRYGIATASRAIGGAIAELPTARRKEEESEYLQKQRIDAIKAAESDSRAIGQAYKSLKTSYSKKATVLVQQGMMTQEEMNKNLADIPVVTSIDRKNPGGYIDRLSGKMGELYKDLRQKEVSGGVGQAVRGREEVPSRMGERGMPSLEMQPTPLGEESQTRPREGEVTGARPYEEPIAPAGTQAEIARSRFLPPGTTMEQLEQEPQFETAPTEMGMEREKRLGEREKRLGERKEYDEAMMQYRWATLNYRKTKDEKTLRLATDKAREISNRLIGSKKTDLKKLDMEKKELEKGTEDILSGETTVDWDAIKDKEVQIIQLQDEIDGYISEKKMIGAMPGETKKFQGARPRGAQPTVPPIPTAPTGEISKMEQAIRDSLTNRENPPDQATIEEYIARLKRLGRL